MPAQPTVAIVGATGAVGREFLTVLEERDFPIGELKLLASARSAGTRLPFRGALHEVHTLDEHSFKGVDLALFSAGGSISEKFCPIAAKAGALVIDNSSFFRMHADVPLIVPEVNGHVLDTWLDQRAEGPCEGGGMGGVIANPNCSTIIALMAVTPLHRAAGVQRMVVSTYQAASGGGAAMLAELEQQARDFVAGKPYNTKVAGRQAIFNVYSHNSAVGPDGYNTEETKLVKETRKMWGTDDVAITATCVRVPVPRAHSEAINLTFCAPLTEAQAFAILRDPKQSPGVTVVDDRVNNRFPEPVHAAGKDDVLVGRIRADHSQPLHMGLNLFVSGDQVRKGAALNAVQIAERVVARKCAASPTVVAR